MSDARFPEHNGEPPPPPGASNGSVGVSVLFEAWSGEHAANTRTAAKPSAAVSERLISNSLGGGVALPASGKDFQIRPNLTVRIECGPGKFRLRIGTYQKHTPAHDLPGHSGSSHRPSRLLSATLMTA